jgi:chorismate synthase
MNSDEWAAYFIGRIAREILQARKYRAVSIAVANRVSRPGGDLTPWDTRATKPEPAPIWLLAFFQRLSCAMSFNTFGHLFRVTTFGESHGPAIGCVVDGCPPRIPLTEADIQPYLDRRRPGQSRYTTQRQEPDAVKILSGVFPDPESGAQVTTGTPIALVIDNVDQRSKDYSAIKDKYRPGHADYTYDIKYGLRDYRGGGRQSARETAMRVAAGAVARKVVPGLNVRAALVQMGPHRIDRANWDWAEVERNPFFCPDAKTAAMLGDYLDGLRKSGSSIGAVIEVVADGVPPGLGAPIYGKLDGDLAAALMSINAVKGVEIGAGFGAAKLTGEENGDEMRMGNDGKPRFLSNHAGGILGGISTGQPVVARFAVKPTSSILTPRQTVDRYGHETDISTTGRHDPCVGIRAVPIGEAMVACVIADHYLRQRGQVGDTPAWPFAAPQD